MNNSIYVFYWSHWGPQRKCTLIVKQPLKRMILYQTDYLLFCFCFLFATKVGKFNQRGSPLSWLTAHNWQKWKRVFLTCPCHEIYRDEAVGLKSCKYTLKNTIYVNMWNLGQFRENLIFCQQLLNWSSNLKILLHMCDTYNYDYLQHSTFRFN